MKNILLSFFCCLSFSITAQDSLTFGLHFNNTSFPLSTGNPPIFQIYSKNTTSKDILLIENIKYEQRGTSIWAIEIENEQGQLFKQAPNLTIFKDTFPNHHPPEICTKIITSNQSYNKDIYPMFLPPEMMFDWWQVYGFPPGKYKIRLTYELTPETVEQIGECTITKNPNFELGDLWLGVIQTPWIDFEIGQSAIYFPIDYQKVSFQKVKNSHLNWMNQLSVVQDGKHILEQLYDTHNNIVAEFRPNKPTDKPTLINIYNEKFQIEDNTIIEGQYRWYAANIYGLKYDAWWQTMRGEGQVVNGKLEGVIYEYAPYSGRNKNILNYKNGIQHGQYQHWRKNGDSPDFVLLKEGFFKNGFPDGQYSEYYENGNIHFEMKYDLGLIDGTTIHYYQNGKIAMISHYKPEIIEAKSYLNDNRILAGKLCDDTQIKHGDFITYNKKGKMIQKRTYRNNLLTGQHFQRIKVDGKTIKTIGFYKDGQPWKGQFISIYIQRTRGRYGVESKQTIHRLTYKNGKIVEQELLKEGDRWDF